MSAKGRELPPTRELNQCLLTGYEADRCVPMEHIHASDEGRARAKNSLRHAVLRSIWLIPLNEQPSLPLQRLSFGFKRTLERLTLILSGNPHAPGRRAQCLSRHDSFLPGKPCR